MRVVWLGAVLVGAGAMAREIPVYREYTVPISFSEWADVQDVGALDLVEGQAFRKEKSLEEKMGKETIMDIAIQGGMLPASGPSMPTPAATDNSGERRRSGKEETDKNWLINSLTLAALGQGSSNATASAGMSRDVKESSRGWLADEVMRTSVATEAAQAAWEQERADVEQAELDATKAMIATREKNAAPSEASISDAAAKRNQAAAAGRTPSGSEATRPGDVPRASLAPSGEAGRAQPRPIVAENLVIGRPDMSSWRTVPGQPTAKPAEQSTPRTDSPPFASQFSPPSWGGASATKPGASWQAGWKSESAGFFSPSLNDPVVLPTVPAATAPRQPPVSSGLKPGWH